MTAPPGDGARLFIVEAYSARIKILENGSVLGTPFIDLGPVVTDAGAEQGLLGLAFHPDYASSGFFYVYYIDNGGQAAVARYSGECQAQPVPVLGGGAAGLIVLLITAGAGLARRRAPRGRARAAPWPQGVSP